MPTRVRLQVDGQDVVEIRGFGYTSDVLAIGEESTFEVVNTGGKYTSGLRAGTLVEVYFSNPEFNNGDEVLKFRGRLIDRKPKINPQRGSIVEVTCADLGWHIQNCCGPLWYRLDRAVFGDLVDPGKVIGSRDGSPIYFIDPTFGFRGIRFDKDASIENRRLKMGIVAFQTEQQKILSPVLDFSVKAGEKLWSTISEHARRFNKIVNVSADGLIMVYSPDYDQQPFYRIRNRPGDSRNNIIEGEGVNTCRTMHTEVEVVGHLLGGPAPGTVSGIDPHEGSLRGSIVHPELLPFRNYLSASDSEQHNPSLAQAHAAFLYLRGLYDAWSFTYKLPGHGQGGYWFESDTMVDVDDEEAGHHGIFYVSSVHQTVEIGVGEVTYLTIRRPGLLTAAFGELGKQIDVEQYLELRNQPIIRYLPGSGKPRIAG